MKILKITLSIIILLSFILVGTPIKYNCIELNILIVLIGTIYIFYKSFIKKRKNNKKKNRYSNINFFYISNNSFGI